MDNTIIQQGSFVSDGSAKTVMLRNGVDWIRVINLTQSAAMNNAGVNFFWQDGMGQGAAIVQSKTGGGNGLVQTVIEDGGFTLIDTSASPLGVQTALTSISNATPPRVLVAATAGLSTGNVVRFVNVTGAAQLGGIDFEITVIDGTHFDLTFMTAIVAATAGNYRVIAHDPLYAPVPRYITEITQAAQAVVTVSVTPLYQVGQVVRIVNPSYSAYGMQEINGLSATIVAIDAAASAITLDIDSSSFSAFAFPVTAEAPFTPAQIVPFGQNTGEANISNTNVLADSVVNTGYIGIELGAGAGAPAGVNNDDIFWVAGSSFSDIKS